MAQQLFDYTGGPQKFNIPNGVKILTITLKGAGASGNPAGGVTGKLKVGPDSGIDTLWIDIGQNGRPASGAGNRQGGAAAYGGGGPGGDGTGTGNGGDGGGGATVIRKNSASGTILAVAGGAGGDSGAAGDGGKGGAVVGGPGEKGTGTGGGGGPTGGTQNQGGKGGNSAIGAAFNGNDGGGKLGNGGRGGQRATGTNVTGGGGGGGGYYPGGGGQAGRVGVSASWGGAGGSNYDGGLYSATSVRGVGTLGHGQVLIEWEGPGGNNPPVPPVDITIDGKPIQDGLATKATTEVLLRGIPNDPDHEQGVRMWVAMATTPTFTEYRTFKGTYDAVEKRDKVLLTGLVQEKRYYLRMFTQDKLGKISTNYRSTNFWTNRRPNPPVPVLPGENVEITPLMNVTFSWTYSDPDDPDPQTGFQMVYRKAATPVEPAGEWIIVPTQMSPQHQWVLDAGSFKGFTFYEWMVRTRDSQGAWGEFSAAQSFFVVAISQPPTLISPINNNAIPITSGVSFGTATIQVSDAGLATTSFSGQPDGAYQVNWGAGGQVEDYVSTGGVWSPNAPEYDYGSGGFAHAIEIEGPGNYHIEHNLTQANGVAVPPQAMEVEGSSIVIAPPAEFRWKFRSPTSMVQERADIRWRPAGLNVGAETGWTVITGDEVNPGMAPVMEVDFGETLEPHYRYEWQARTYVAGGQASDWSESGFFYAVPSPGSGAGLLLLDSGRPAAPLSQGQNRAFVFERGGQRLLGEITPFSQIRWNRQRDDISECLVTVNEWDDDGKAFLGRLRTWMHEIVVYRDNGEEMQRVWEGPITRISGSKEKLEVEAKDVMAYVYRRIMQQGYDDSYRIINNIQVGLKTVVQRASQIIMNSLAYDDPNVLPYLTPLHDPFDARTSRIVKDFSKTAWEEVDDLAATAGLDYVTAGRRILLWDTHRPIGRLPEMRDGDFSEPPIVTEYGMSAANIFAVTNNNGIWGGAQRGFTKDPNTGLTIIPPQGFIEQLASAYGEEEGGGTSEVMTRAAAAAMRASLTAQANRNIEGRWFPPVVARIPDNATLSPDLNITINQLIPGVWIPLRADGGVREVSQWQKLDSMKVEQTAQGEKVSVVMSPAPQEGADPDADSAQEAE